MGKTAQGAVWLNAERLSDFDYWQYWRNVDDADVGRFLRLFTELPLAEIARLEALEGAELNEAKKILADRGDQAVPGAGRRPRRRPKPRARSSRRNGRHEPPGRPTVEVSALRSCAQGISCRATCSRAAASPPARARRGG